MHERNVEKSYNDYFQKKKRFVKLRIPQSKFSDDFSGPKFIFYLYFNMWNDKFNMSFCDVHIKQFYMCVHLRMYAYADIY